MEEIENVRLASKSLKHWASTCARSLGFHTPNEKNKGSQKQNKSDAKYVKQLSLVPSP